MKSFLRGGSYRLVYGVRGGNYRRSPSYESSVGNVLEGTGLQKENH